MITSGLIWVIGDNGSRHDPRGRKVVRRKQISNVTLRKELRYLSGFLNWLCRQRPPYLRENPISLSNAKSIQPARDSRSGV